MSSLKLLCDQLGTIVIKKKVELRILICFIMRTKTRVKLVDNNKTILNM